MSYETLILAKYEGEEKEEMLLAECQMFADFAVLATMKWLARAAEALIQNLKSRFW